MKTPAAIASVLLLVASCGKLREHSVPRPARTLTFAFYNVENLFDPADDPAIAGDDEFTPSGPKHWTDVRLERKLTGIARAIRAVDDYRGPDLIGLCEVENRHVLDMLVGEYLPRDEYSVVHLESPDERGIDVALLYRGSSMMLVGQRAHVVDLGPRKRPTRDILEATFERGGCRFTVLVNHWPSKLGGSAASDARRQTAAQVARAIVDSLTALDPAADIVLLGDFNDVPSSEPITGVLDAHAIDDRASFDGALINTAAPVETADTIGSYYYRGRWETIDQIMLSRGVLDSTGLMLYQRAESILDVDFLRDEHSRSGSPRRTYRGTMYAGGVSDHFPVYLVVEMRPKSVEGKR